MASEKVEAALKQAIEDLVKEKAQLSREVGQLRRQVSELEGALTAERQKVKDVLDALKVGVRDTVASCEAIAVKPRKEVLRLQEDELEELTSPRPPQEDSVDPPMPDLPKSRASHPPLPFWKVPFRRRMQTLCTLLFTWTTPLFVSVAGMVIVLASRNVTAIAVLLIYVGWMFILDDEAPRNGRPWWLIRRVRGLKCIWKCCAEYYPLQLVRTVALPAENNYMFCLHPHGVFSLSHAINFASNGTGFFELFPGIKCFLCTLRQQFKIPFHREYVMGMGAMEVSRDAILNTLSRGPGYSVALVPGGAQEALDAFNGTMRLTILKRKGFVRCALRTGASLVPVISFGENELYVARKGAKRWLIMRLWEKLLKRCYGLASPSAMGRGVFITTCPDPFMLPFRKPVTTVVGKPLALPRLPNPLPEDVDHWHAKYVDALKELFERTAPQYGPGLQLELM